MLVALVVGVVPMPTITVAVAQDPLEPVVSEMPDAGEPYWSRG